MKKKFTLTDLDCANCAAKMEDAINKIDGVTAATVSFIQQKMTIEADDARFDDIMTFWDEIAGVYDLAEATNRKAYREAVRRVRELIPQWASVLECAAGTGEFSLAAAERA